MEVDGEAGSKAIEGIGVILAREVARVIDRRYISDSLEVNAHSLSQRVAWLA